MSSIKHVGVVKPIEKIKIAEAFKRLNKNVSSNIANLNWHSTMNSMGDMLSSDGGREVFIANDRQYTYLAEKEGTHYNVSVVAWA